MRNRIRRFTASNVRLAFLFEGLQSLGRGIWLGNVLSLYIVLFAEKSDSIFGLAPNELLGVTAGITGIAMTALVFPSGYLADRFRRDWMLKAAGVVGIVAMFILGVADNIILIFLSMFLWGAFQGITRPAFESILADSLPAGGRSKTYAKLHLVGQGGMAIGPFLNVFLFMILGDIWDISILRAVMIVGIITSMLSVLVLFLFKDERSMGDESESVFLNNGEDNSDESKELSRRAKRIPLLLVSANLIVGMGAGMTVRFFPVFFRSIYHMNPVSVQLVMAGTFIFTGAFGIIAQKFSLKKGRAEMILLLQLSAIACLVFIGFYPAVIFLVPLFILRGSLMNAAQPLSRSILMDVIPKKHRGKWSSLQTISWGLFWNASAAVGGFLIGDNNFRLCFFVTAGIYFLGTIPVLFLIPLVNKEVLTK